MMTLMNLVYALPLVIALVIAGAVVHGRVMGTARTLMWSGIAAVCLTRLAGMFLPALVTDGSMVAYGVANLILNVLATVGIVTCGKAHYDLMEVLRRLDISPQMLADLTSELRRDWSAV